MANAPFTRDEVILLIDASMRAQNENFSPNDSIIIELSALLNDLPIFPKEGRPKSFRNTIGIYHQISGFRKSFDSPSYLKTINSLFSEIYEEGKNGVINIQETALAIRRNKDAFTSTPFGTAGEALNFPEGALLGHLHRVIETRDGKKLKRASCCQICFLDLNEIYKPSDSIYLQMHLTVPPTQLDAEHHYSDKDFITVCPNCHSVLHSYRPWLSMEMVKDILR